MKSRFFHIGEPQFSFASICLVEGKDDAMFIECVLDIVGASSDQFRIIVCEGKENLRSALNLLSKSADFALNVKNVSVVFDADADRARSLTEIHKIYRDLGLPVTQAGEFSEKDGKHFGTFLLPGNEQQGELEDLALGLAQDNEVLREANLYIDRIEGLGAGNKLSKRKVQAFLAGASDLLRPTVGWAFRDGTIAFSEDQVSDFARFIRRQIELAA